jgi:hypothetical protein
MFCPTCGQDIEWVDVEGDVQGGWWECEEKHRWRRSFGGFAPVRD